MSSETSIGEPTGVAVHSDPETLGGALVFVGTRLPVATVAACLAEGDTLEALQRGWPYLTQAHLDVALAAEAEGR